MKTTPLKCRQLIRNIIVRLMSGYVIHYIIYVPTNVFFLYIYNSYNSTTIKKRFSLQQFKRFTYTYVVHDQPTAAITIVKRLTDNRFVSFFFLVGTYYAFLFDSRRKMIFRIRARRSYITITYPATAWVGHMANYEISYPRYYSTQNLCV
jgi:hypothetical protein